MADTSLVFNILAKDKASKAFDKLKGAALAAGTAIGLSLGGGAAQALEKSKLDAVMAAQIGATPEMAASFGKLSGQIYADNFGDSMESVNAALKSVWQNGLIPEDAADADIKRVTEKLLTVGTVIGEDANRVSMAVKQMLRTGMAKSAEEAFDLIVRAQQQGINKSGDLLDTLNEYGTQFRKLGLDGPQAMGLISQAIRAGARDSDIAADAIKEFSIRAIDGSKLTAQGFKMLGLDADKMAQQIARGGTGATKGLDTVLDRLRNIKDPVKQAQAATALFGTQAEDLGDALFAMDLSGAATEMGKLAGATDKAATTIGESAGAKLDTFKRKAQIALVEGLAQAVPTLEKIGAFVQRNSDAFLILGGVMAGFAATMLVVNAVTATWATIQTIVSAATKVWAAVQWILNLALWSNPITLIVVGVIALIAVIVLIATKTTWFQTIWKVAWGAIKAAAMFVFNWIVGGWKWAIGLLVSGVKLWWSIFSGTWTRVGQVAAAIWNWIVARAVDSFNRIRNGFTSLVGFIRGLPGRISAAASGLFNGIKFAFKLAINWIISKWNNLSFHLPSVTIPVLGTVGGATLSTPNIPFLATGTSEVFRSGLAVIHRGEQVIPAAQVSRSRPTAGGTVISVEAGGGGSPADRAFASMFLNLVRTGAIQLTVVNNRVQPA